MRNPPTRALSSNIREPRSPAAYTDDSDDSMQTQPSPNDSENSQDDLKTLLGAALEYEAHIKDFNNKALWKWGMIGRWLLDEEMKAPKTIRNNATLSRRHATSAFQQAASLTSVEAANYALKARKIYWVLHSCTEDVVGQLVGVSIRAIDKLTIEEAKTMGQKIEQLYSSNGAHDESDSLSD